jgi:hypothetical protein
MVGPDALDVTHRARSEAGTRTIGNTEIHGDADERDIQDRWRSSAKGRSRKVGIPEYGKVRLPSGLLNRERRLP